MSPEQLFSALNLLASVSWLLLGDLSPPAADHTHRRRRGGTGNESGVRSRESGVRSRESGVRLSTVDSRLSTPDY
jgi:hypothetical protein